MKIKCMLCDRVDHLDENEFIAKRIRNNPLTSYLCATCDQRIAEKTKVRQKNNQGDPEDQEQFS